MLFNRIKAEWKLHTFALDDVNGDILDIEKTFTPKPKPILLIVKLGFLGWVIQVIAHDISRTDFPGYWLAFMTNWQCVFILAYFTCSFLLMTPLIQVPLVSQYNNDEIASNLVFGSSNARNFVIIWIKSTWLLYAISLNIGLLATILFWVLVYDANTFYNPYDDIMRHGILFTMVFIDGMVINRIPIRLKQLVWVEAVDVSYVVWLAIHQFASIGNPFVDGRDVLYDSIDFQKSPLFAFVLIFCLAVFAVPLFFTLFMTISSFIKPRSLIHTTDDNVDEEEGKFEND